MNRLGFRHDNLRRTLPELLASANLALDAVYTHFATADEPGAPAVRRRSARDSKPRAATLDELGAGPRLRHAANTAALLRDSRVWYDFVRPGLLLYGIVPPPLASTIALQPVMSLTSRVVAVKGVRAGEGSATAADSRADRPVTLGCHSRRLR